MPTKLGQNFLHDEKIIKKIIQAANLQPEDFVIEIGPGEGILTEKLAEKVKRVLAIEIDATLSKFLEKRFRQQKNITIINADILKTNFVDLISNFQFPISNKIPNSNDQNPKSNQNIKYKVVANIPYYITSPIIRLFLESETPPQEMILMVQKEVAERIVEKPGKMSILALSVQYYATAQILFSVPAKAFSPVPKVDSAVIKIIPIKKLPVRSQREAEKFFRIIRAGFSAKRKTLANNLANGFHLDKKEIEIKLNSIGLTPLTRAQELSLEDWKKLAKII